MRKIILIVLFLSFCFTAYAHPPSKIALTYDSQTKIVKAIITHPVSNPKSHFIEKVDVALNGKKIIEHKIIVQENNTTQTVSYLIPNAKSSDTISVEAYCSISGKLIKEITIE